MAAFWARNEFTGTVDLTEIGLTRALTDLLSGCLCVALTFRCRRLAGTVPVKPVAAKIWITKKKAIVRGTWDRDALIIRMLQFTLLVKTGRVVGQSRDCDVSTGAAEY